MLACVLTAGLFTIMDTRVPSQVWNITTFTLFFLLLLKLYKNIKPEVVFYRKIIFLRT